MQYRFLFFGISIFCALFPYTSARAAYEIMFRNECQSHVNLFIHYQVNNSWRTHNIFSRSHGKGSKGAGYLGIVTNNLTFYYYAETDPSYTNRTSHLNKQYWGGDNEIKALNHRRGEYETLPFREKKLDFTDLQESFPRNYYILRLTCPSE